MELIGRMLDGSIPEPAKGGGHERGRLFGFRVKQDDKIARLAEVPLLEGCTRNQLKAVAKIAEVREATAGTVLTRKILSSPDDYSRTIRVGLQEIIRETGMAPGDVATGTGGEPHRGSAAGGKPAAPGARTGGPD